MVYQDLLPLAPSTLKGNSKFEILLVKVFSLKQKQIKYFQLLKKSHFVASRKQPHFPSDKNFIEIGNHAFN